MSTISIGEKIICLQRPKMDVQARKKKKKKERKSHEILERDPFYASIKGLLI